MSSRSIVQVFETYQKSRLSFAQTVSDLASRQQNVDAMKSADVLELLKPLVTDVCPQIRQSASIALGRLVHNDPQLAADLVTSGLLNILLQNASAGNKFQKSAVLFVIRSICKHNASMAETVIKNGGLQTLVFCLEDFEPSVKESAAWGIGYIARHEKKLAQDCVNVGVLPLLMLCLQEPELSLKQIATSAITDISKHGEDLAMSVVDAGTVPYLAKNLYNSDEKLKKQCLAALSSIAKHSPELAEVVVEAEIIPTVSQHLSHPCPTIRRNAASLIRDVAKQSLELTQLIVNTGAVGSLLEVLLQFPTKPPDPSNDARVPCVSALGFIAGQSAQLAMTVLGCRTIQVLARILNECTDESLLTVTAWTIGQIGRHGPPHAAAVASANIFPRLLYFYERKESSVDLKSKCHTALKQCLQNCLIMKALEPLLSIASPEILKYLLGQYSKAFSMHFVDEAEEKERQEQLRLERMTLRDKYNMPSTYMPEMEFRKCFRLSRDLAQRLITDLTPHMTPVIRAGKIPIQIRILGALRFFAQGSYQNAVGDFNACMAQPTFSRALGEVSLALEAIAPQWVQFPLTEAEKQLNQNT